jgi:CRISPR-associated protein Csy3
MSVELPTVLSYERKLETSDALMFAGNWEDTDEPQVQDWQVIAITKRQNRSTQSAFGIDDAKKSQPNPVSSDSDDANLPHGTDTLKVSFSVRIIGNVGNPFSCDDPDFEKVIKERMAVYKKEDGLKTLAFRYAYNIASGRFLWRNRVCANKILIKVRKDGNEDMTFNGYDFALNNFEKNEKNTDLTKLTDIIYAGLNGDGSTFSFIEVDAYVKLGNSQHIFPSQEMNMGEKKKVLFKLAVDGKDCAAIHNVKIGNAIRTIDNWYKNAEFPIAVEPYGSVTQKGQAYRKTEKDGDLYSLMLDWLNEKPVNDGDKNFIVANLIRGGVFGGKSDQ